MSQVFEITDSSLEH